MKKRGTDQKIFSIGSGRRDGTDRESFLGTYQVETPTSEDFEHRVYGVLFFRLSRLRDGAERHVCHEVPGVRHADLFADEVVFHIIVVLEVGTVAEGLQTEPDHKLV